jgi:hypothetical protein
MHVIAVMRMVAAALINGEGQYGTRVVAQGDEFCRGQIHGR